MNEAKICFRVDSSNVIGTGHVMRCLTLANQLRAKGLNSHFICRAHTGHIADRIIKEGFGVSVLPLKLDTDFPEPGNDYQHWLGASGEEDSTETTNYMKTKNFSWLIVDHYAIDAKWQHMVQNVLNVKIMVIDGQANRQHACDLLLDPALSEEGEDRWQKLVPDTCHLFVGPTHALLRPEFMKAKQKHNRRRTTVQRVFVGFGGADPHNATGLALEAVLALHNSEIAIDVVVGSAYEHLDTLNAQCSAFQQVRLHVDADNIAELMSKADLAIGGGGGMMLERCFLNLPTVAISIAENQVKFSEEMDKAGAVIYLGNLADITIEEITVTIRNLMDNGQILSRMHACSEKIMNKNGPKLIPTLLEES